MGKKHIIETNQEDLIKEKEKVEEIIKKEARVKSTAAGVLEGKVYVSSSYNNTIVTLTNLRGQFWPGSQQVQWDLKELKKPLLLQPLG
jgi:hypothetical protein